LVLKANFRCPYFTELFSPAVPYMTVTLEMKLVGDKNYGSSKEFAVSIRFNFLFTVY
jgi:hypothetical protein